MARKFKTYVTSIGFFDLAVAAPSMKAALEAWGSERNLFHQGFAQETDDPKIVDATMAKPGTVLKRPVGSHGAFTEQAELPKSLPSKQPNARAIPKAKPPKAAKHKPTAKVVSFADARAARLATAAFEKERERREREDHKEEAVRKKEQQRRDDAAAKVQTAFDKAEARHDEIVNGIEAERDALGRRADSEDARWATEKRKYEAALRQVRE